MSREKINKQRLKNILKHKKKMKITNSNEPASKNFLISEYWCPTVTPEKIDFDMPDCLAAAVQVFRDFFNVPWQITSVIRPNDASWSPHVNGQAVDSVSADTSLWGEILIKIRTEFQNWKTSQLVKDVVATGCNVLLIENGCLHLSVRTTNLNSTAELGNIYVGEWVNDGSVYGLNTAYSSNTI